MQRGWVERHRQGWRGGWREDGRKRYTKTVPLQKQAKALLQKEMTRLAAGLVDRDILFEALADRFLSTLPEGQTKGNRTTALAAPRRLWGERLCADILPADIETWLIGFRPSTRSSYVGALRQLFKFGVRNRLTTYNPAAEVKASRPVRSDGLLPFQDWAEVERLAAECGRWRALVILAVDTGARPGELIRLRHADIEDGLVHLPGTKTRNAKRAVHLTDRGLEAYASIIRRIDTPYVFPGLQGAYSWRNWRSRVWLPALELARLERRSPYQMRHTFAFFSLRASVPISDLSVEMGHASIAQTHDAYGHWSNEMGRRAASLREAWAAP